MAYMQVAPHVFIGVFDTTDARLALATGIARHLRLAIGAAGASVLQPLPGQALPDDPLAWLEPIPGLCGHVTASPHSLPPQTPDLVIAIRVRGGRATTQLEIFVVDGRSFTWSRHSGTAAAPSLIASIASALRTANEEGGLGIPEVFTLPDMVAAMTDAGGPRGALRNMEAAGRDLIEQARDYPKSDAFVGGPFDCASTQMLDQRAVA